ncbi:MAG: hypothetical protein A2808_03895 [Candidatus Moranbacteria bacterium RIFCSPHIGHO2_01_FULL_55_24]|nr:MAG: hypothetical protein A2808_03895 [Candidatus Moranbacteria bacterium RIFCSPHIGHO2_01_FULL_55_24]
MKGKRAAKKEQPRRWSARVTRESNVLDLEPGVFTWSDPKRIARSLKRSAEKSVRRKGTPYQSAMSMLNFYINRAGKNLSTERKRLLARTKRELRTLFGRSG